MAQGATGLLAGSVDFFHEAALTTSSSVGVDDPLRGGFVETLHCHAHVFSTFWSTCTGGSRLHTSAKFALDRLIALLALGVGKDALFLALDVCHGRKD